MRTALLVTAACAACLPICAQVETYETGRWADIRVAAQETNGPIHLANAGGVWCPWHWEENWQPGNKIGPGNSWSSGDLANGIAASMDTARDGTVISIWAHKTDGSVFVVSERGNNSGLLRLSGLRGPVALARVMMDSQTNLWVTEAGVNICKSAAPNFWIKALLHAITIPELWPGGDPTNRLPVSMAEDARDRVWFWSSCLAGDDSRGAVHGVLIQEKGAVTNLQVLDGVPEGRISVIAPLDGATLWLAVRDAGIFSVNLDNLAGARVAEPETNAFRIVQNIFSVGEDRYVISGGQADLNRDGLLSVLWRRRDGHWTKLIDGLDTYGSQEQLADRHWRLTKEGLWLGAFGMGGWFAPLDDGPPQAINWQKNSPFDTINRWFQLQDGRMLGLQFERGGLVAGTALLMAKPALPSGASIVLTARPLFRTVEARVFAVLRGDECALSEWDGKQWHRHSFPDNLPLWGECTITSDSRGRVWIVDARYSPYVERVPTYIFDPGQGGFTNFPNLRAALQAQLAAPPDFRTGNARLFAPEFTSDGRICYESEGHWVINYFDGRQWHEWNQINQIMTGEVLRPNRQESRPFFTKDGRLSVVMNGGVWQFDDPAGWKKSGVKPDAALPVLAPKDNFATRPYEPAADSIVAGEDGVFWVVAGGQLFRNGYGLRVACFAPNESQPFADKRKLTEVLADKFGNAFLRTSVQGRDEYVFLPAHGPLSHVTAKLVEDRDDGVTLQLAADIPSPRFTWRVDDGPWSQAATNQTLRLEYLSVGQHRVQIMALDEKLQTGPAPAEVSFETHTIPAQQIQKLIAQLGDKDFALREAAVKSLSRHAEATLPALREARESERDPGRRWWLDAAIQQCDQGAPP